MLYLMSSDIDTAYQKTYKSAVLAVGSGSRFVVESIEKMYNQMYESYGVQIKHVFDIDDRMPYVEFEFISEEAQIIFLLKHE